MRSGSALSSRTNRLSSNGQGRLPDDDRIQVVIDRSNGVHVVAVLAFTQQGLAVEFVSKVPVLHVAGHSLGRPLLRVCQPDRVHFRPQADELVDGLPRRLVFKLPKHFFVGGRIVRVVGWIVARIKIVGIGEHVGVDVVGSELVTERVGVCEGWPRSLPVR